MKKIFIAIVALAAATACSNSEIVSVNREAIGFDNAFVNNSTRSVVDPSYTNDNLFADFAVYGFVTGEATAPIFDGTKVSAPNWTYAGTQYWVDGAKYDFHAVAPLTSGNWTDAVATTETLSLSFTNDGETDLLYAINDYGVYNYVAGTAVGKVGFNFRHVLSKVKFSFLNNYNATNSYLRVSNIKIENAYLTATAELNKKATVWDTHDGTLELSFGNANTTSTSTDAVKFAKDAEVESHNELLLIPGATPEDGYMVTFTVEVLVGDTVIKTYNHVAAANFTPVAGYSYDIKATLSHTNLDPEQAQEPIEFTVTSIGGWETTDQNKTM